VAARQARHFVSTHPDSLLWWLDDDLDLCREMLPRLRSTGWQVRTFARSEPMLAALRAGLRPDLGHKSGDIATTGNQRHHLGLQKLGIALAPLGPLDLASKLGNALG
jgi:hypothetical protein